MILTKNALFRSYDTFAHIRNINMRMYITSARGHELSGHVRAHAYNYYMPGLNVHKAECGWVAK